MQDETSEHEESSRKSQFGIGCVTILAKEISWKLVFWQANIEKVLRNCRNGTQTTIKTDWNEHFEDKITRKQRRLRRISEIVHDVMPAGCGLGL